MSEIWIVDDAVFMRVILKNIIVQNFGCDIREFANGEDVVNAYKQVDKNNENVSLILMDITMPQMDGITALKEIMKINPKQNIVMCSNIASSKTVVECVKSGAKHFIAKPFSEEKVIDTVADFVDKVEYDENDFVINMEVHTFYRLIRMGKIEDIKGYIRSGYDLNSNLNDKTIAQAIVESKNKEVYDLIMNHEDKLSSKNRNVLKGLRLRELTNLTWDGRMKQTIEQ